MTEVRERNLFDLLGPGIIVAATGVGAGDLLTASLGGAAVGVQIAWAAVVGAVLKWFLNEGLARWQLVTGTTLLEGWITRLGPWVQWVFLAYLLCWTFFTGGALISACGVAGAGLLPVGSDPTLSKKLWGVVHSLAGVVLVRLGGFRLFERLMAVLVGLMFLTVIATALLARPQWPAVARGLLVPTIPVGGLGWVLGVLGGVGGTLTLLSYGYWIREVGRRGVEGVRACRIDLTVGYAMTALFGIAMVIVGSKIEIQGGGAKMALVLAGELARSIGPVGRWIFLLGFWGAVFSSLLGVWQSVPYLFADFLALRGGPAAPEATDLTRTPAYRRYLLVIAIVPLPMLWVSVKRAQLTYAILGSLFMPFLALTLLLMNNRGEWIGSHNNGLVANLVLVLTLGLFAYAGYGTVASNLAALLGR